MLHLPPRGPDRIWRTPEVHHNCLIIMVKITNCGGLDWRQCGPTKGWHMGCIALGNRRFRLQVRPDLGQRQRCRQ
jgi:hypothetical protein